MFEGACPVLSVRNTLLTCHQRQPYLGPMCTGKTRPKATDLIKYRERFCSGKFFLLLNSCSNFLIYVMCSPKFRRLLTKELGKIFRQIPHLYLYQNPEYLFAVHVSYISVEFLPMYSTCYLNWGILKRNLSGGLPWRRKVGRVQEDALQEQNLLIQ